MQSFETVNQSCSPSLTTTNPIRHILNEKFSPTFHNKLFRLVRKNETDYY